MPFGLYGLDRLNDMLESSPRSKNMFVYSMSGFPIVGDLYRAVDKWNYANQYLSNRGVDWADIKYPTMAFGSGSSPLYTAVQPSLKSLEDLYENQERKYDRNLRRHALNTSIEANNMRRAWYYSRM